MSLDSLESRLSNDAKIVMIGCVYREIWGVWSWRARLVLERLTGVSVPDAMSSGFRGPR